MAVEQPDARFYLVAGACSAALALALGAFGAHALRGSLSPDSLSVFETGVRYQFYHAFGLLIVGILLLICNPSQRNGLLWTGRCFIAGTVLFSGSLYALGIAGIGWIGFITPVGGLAWIAGWCILAVTLLRNAHTPQS